jgi:3-oxoacyl-[acyl-carrier protein] reductase
MLVHWLGPRIETQDALFARERQIARFVELGPSSTLTNMASKTRVSRYDTVDSLLGLHREFLSSVENLSRVRYHYESRPDADEETEEEDVTSEIVDTTAQPAPPADAPTSSASDIVPTASIDDVPMHALQLITMLVAFKLRKSMGKISARQSLKDLSSGKSSSLTYFYQHPPNPGLIIV